MLPIAHSRPPFYATVLNPPNLNGFGAAANRVTCAHRDVT